MSNLKELETLDLSENMFRSLPSVVYSLFSLKTLQMWLNTFLQEIEDKILHLEKLETVSCGDCDTLVSPPASVCFQGISAIREHFIDLLLATGIESKEVPVAVVGNNNTGTSSVIKSLLEGKLTILPSQELGLLDGTTDIFKIEDLPLEHSHVKLLNYGSRRVYSISKHLALPDRCVPLVVVDIQEYSRLSTHADGPKEAARIACFDVLAQMYLVGSKLGPPILVFINLDKLEEEKRGPCKEEFFGGIKRFHREILEVEVNLYPLLPKLLHDVEHLCNRETDVFDPDDIFEFHDGDDTDVVERLRSRIDERCKKYVTKVPQLYSEIAEYLERQAEKPFVTFSGILAEFPNTYPQMVLRHMHNVGKLLWLESVPALSDYVFHRVPLITELIETLCEHSSHEPWKQHIGELTPFIHNQQSVEKEKYEALVKEFTTTGLLDESLLNHLIGHTSPLPLDIAVELLKTFYILYGPVEHKQRNVYVSPNFSNNVIDEHWKTDGCLQIRGGFIVNGVCLPWFHYQMVMVEVLKCTLGTFSESEVTIVKKGLSIRHGNTATYFTFDDVNRVITLQVSTTVEQLPVSWKHMLDTTDKLRHTLSESWQGSHEEFLLYCVHCLFLRHPKPGYDADPDWVHYMYRKRPDDTKYREKFTGSDIVFCDRATVKKTGMYPSVPKPLKYASKLPQAIWLVEVFTVE